jgi:hypothetical protein
MNIFRVLLYIFLAIFIYKFVFNFLVPVIKMSWRVRSQIKEFQRQHQQQDPLQQNTAANNNGQSSANNTTASKPKAGDYIDFEEVKD